MSSKDLVVMAPAHAHPCPATMPHPPHQAAILSRPQPAYDFQSRETRGVLQASAPRPCRFLQIRPYPCQAPGRTAVQEVAPGGAAGWGACPSSLTLRSTLPRAWPRSRYSWASLQRGVPGRWQITLCHVVQALPLLLLHLYHV